MSDKILAVIDPEGDIKEQLQSIRDNFLNLQKDSLKGAAQVLTLAQLPANVTVSSASYVSIGLKSSITTSGGLVFLYAITGLDFGAGTGVMGTKITIDDDVKSESKASDGSQASIVNMWAGTLGAGVHIIDLQCKAIAGTPTALGGLTNTTFLCAVEFII